MAGTKGRQGGGGKLVRTETVTVRLDPKLRYAAELAARKQRRTVSSFIEWAIEASLEHVFLMEDESESFCNTLKDEVEGLWDVDEADRFVKLAIRWPDLLTHDEQMIWKLVRETTWFWGKDVLKLRDTGSGKDYLVDSFHFARLRFFWEQLKLIVQRENSTSEGPKWPKNGPTGDDILPAPQWPSSHNARLEMERLGVTPPEDELFASDGYDWPHDVKNPIRRG
ncbi:MAG: hypothetical protein H7834_12245 [Magnetococcus sp. YQC-9]